jgi:hypothetical protein
MEEERAAVVSSEPEAEMLCGLLRANGIECYFHKIDLLEGAMGMLSAFGTTEIVVRDTDLEHARELLGTGDDV